MSFKFYRVIERNYEIPVLDNPGIFLIPAYLLISIFTHYCISVHKDKKVEVQLLRHGKCVEHGLLGRRP